MSTFLSAATVNCPLEVMGLPTNATTIGGRHLSYVGTLAMIGLVLAIAGPGSASIDHTMDIDTAFDGGVGAGLVAGGLVAAATQFALFYESMRFASSVTRREA